MPSRYGDDDVPKISEFYFRDCMKDMFNRDKYLVIGSKGTGKTFLYQGLKQEELRNKLQERSKLTDTYLFVNLISIHKVRQVIQNKEGLYLADTEVKSNRWKRSSEIREYMRGGK